MIVEVRREDKVFLESFIASTLLNIRTKYLTEYTLSREVLDTLAMAQMRYPYTLGAMLTQFPLKFHIQKSWVWKVSNETI